VFLSVSVVPGTAQRLERSEAQACLKKLTDLGRGSAATKNTTTPNSSTKKHAKSNPTGTSRPTAKRSVCQAEFQKVKIGEHAISGELQGGGGLKARVHAPAFSFVLFPASFLWA
jgi:hypothetical protein